MDKDNDYLIGKAKAASTNKAKGGIHSLHIISMSNHFLWSRLLVHIGDAWEDEHRNHNCLSLSPWLFISEQYFIQYGISVLVYLDQLYHLISPRSFPCPNLHAFVWGRKEWPWYWAYSSSTARTLVYYQHCFNYKCKTFCHTGCYEESNLHSSQM